MVVIDISIKCHPLALTPSGIFSRPALVITLRQIRICSVQAYEYVSWHVYVFRIFGLFAVEHVMRSSNISKTLLFSDSKEVNQTSHTNDAFEIYIY